MIGWYQGFQIGQESHQGYSAEAYKNYSDHEISERCALMLDTATQAECIADAIRDAREQQRAEQDLDAQQQMSYWAKWMLFATLAMAAITLFGVVFVWQTLEATREMASDTKDMAKDTREIGEAQSRAYVHADRAFFFWGDAVGTRPRVEVWVRNTGSTPAKWYTIRFKLLPYEHKESRRELAPCDFDQLPSEWHGPWNAITSNSEGTKATFRLTDAWEIDAAHSAEQDPHGLVFPTHGFSVFGEVKYETFFGEIFVSQFVFGRGSLPPYAVKETRTTQRGEVSVNIRIEEPIPLTRYSAKLQVYRKQDQ